MTRSDFVISMIAAFAKNDHDGFIEDCKAMITFEENKKNFTLANKFKKALDLTPINNSASPQSSFAITPLDFQKTKKLLDDRELQDNPFFSIEDPKNGLEEVILDNNKYLILNEIIKQWRNKEELKNYNLTPQNKILFFGSPGTGKTLSAYAIAKELGLPLLYVHFDSLISSYLGQTGNNLKTIFDYANQNECVVLIDELDAIGKKRDDDHELGELKRIVISLLQNLDSFNNNSLLIACTNHEHLLDSALWRRFDCSISYSFPEFKERMRIFKKEFINKKIKIEEDWISLFSNFTNDLSPSDIVRLINNSIRKWVLYKDKKINLYIIEEIIRNNNLQNINNKEKIKLASILRSQSKKYSLSYLSILLKIPKSTLHLQLSKKEEF